MAALTLAAAFAAPTFLPARAQTSEPPSAFGEALKSWAERYAVRRTFVVVRRGGRTVYTHAIGGVDAQAPVHLASLSKAITAACVATLIRDGKLAFDTPVSDALAKFIAAHGRPRDPRLERVTIGQLLTHRAGFATGDEEDPATGRNFDRYVAAHTSRAPARPELLAAMLRAKLVRDPGAEYAYGNAAYFFLGAVIEEASQHPYEAYCRDAVLKTSGVDGALDPPWRVVGPFAGWRMRAGDYLKFLDLFAADDTRLGPDATAWRLDPAGKNVPSERDAVPPEHDTWYGLGVLVRKRDGGVDVWHWGSWDYTPGKRERGTVRTSFVNYAARAADGTGWFVHAEPRVEEGAPRTDLLSAMYEAYASDKLRTERKRGESKE